MSFQTSMHTSNVFEFSWTIRNFSGKRYELEGPTFSPIPRCSKKFSLSVIRQAHSRSLCWLTVYLTHSNTQDLQHAVVGYTSLRSIDGTILFVRESNFKEEVTQQTLLEESNFPLYKYPCELRLLEDTLIVKGSLTFTNASSPPKDYGQLSEDLKTMYESGLSPDITFSVGEKNLRAHKGILSARSPVFAKMFEQDMLENATNNVMIEDIDFHVFNCFLLFLYTGEAQEWESETVLSLYTMADKYQVKSLQKACSSMLAKKMTVDTVCSVLVLSDLHGDQELKENAKIFFQKNIVQVVGTIKWVEVVTTKPHLAEEVLGSSV